MNILLKTDLLKNDITNKSGVSTRYNVSQEILKTVIINIPSIPEQNKIANFLTFIDKKIALVNEQIEKTKNWKKGLLQQMFI